MPKKQMSTSVPCSSTFVIIIIRELAKSVTRSRPVDYFTSLFRSPEMLDFAAGKPFNAWREVANFYFSNLFLEEETREDNHATVMPKE